MYFEQPVVTDPVCIPIFATSFTGLEITEKIYLGKEDWDSLFQPTDFFTRYKWVNPLKMFIRIVSFYFLIAYYVEKWPKRNPCQGKHILSKHREFGLLKL